MWLPSSPVRLIPVVLIVVGCASSRGAVAPLPPGTVPMVEAPAGTERLMPPEAARRAARSLEPTGLELGTMWTFENPPLEYWRRQYDFAPDAKWLEHVRLASVRYGQGCSASFVSPDGLVMTNHHCARACIEDASTQQRDFVETGFYARTRAEERLCPNLYLDQLIDIRDVTQQVRAAAPAMATSEQVAQAQAAVMQRMEQECQAAGNACQVVPLYQGGQYQLYTYRRFAPVKLVFAPELDAGFFGGDPDNYTYPRYALDVSFVRAYERDGVSPASTPQYFAWDPDGAAEGDLVFVTGNPGSTSRLITVAQLMYERTYRHPFVVSLLEGQRQLLLSIASQGAAQEREVRESLFSVENSLKAYRGQLAGLRDTLLVARKIAWEREFRQRIQAGAQAAEYADVWDRLLDIQRRKLELNAALNLSNAALVGAQPLALATQLAAYMRAAALPEDQRPAQYPGDRLDQLQRSLLQPTAVDEWQARAALELHLTLAQQWLPAEHPLLTQLLAGRPADQAAQQLLLDSRVTAADWRRAALAAGVRADTIRDPLFRAGWLMDSLYSVAIVQWRALVAEETLQRQRLGRALFAAYGTDVPPDATFTLRISDGVIAGYPYNGTVAPPKTTFFGLFARAAEFDNEEPWRLPAAFAKRRDALDLAAPLNFVSTNDISGGNSGSPLIDRNARVVGIAFDGNIEQLPNQFVFSTAAGRTVSVHAAGIIEALRSVYEAHALVEELLQAGGER